MPEPLAANDQLASHTHTTEASITICTNEPLFPIWVKPLLHTIYDEASIALSLLLYSLSAWFGLYMKKYRIIDILASA